MTQSEQLYADHRDLLHWFCQEIKTLYPLDRVWAEMTEDARIEFYKTALSYRERQTTAPPVPARTDLLRLANQQAGLSDPAPAPAPAPVKPSAPPAAELDAPQAESSAPSAMDRLSEIMLDLCGEVSALRAEVSALRADLNRREDLAKSSAPPVAELDAPPAESSAPPVAEPKPRRTKDR